MTDPSPTRKRRRPKVKHLSAWCVHFYTALGLVAAAGIAVLIVRGGADSFRWAFVLMLVAVLIDATDGFLARRVRVKEVLPGFDGRRLDDLTDFLNYTCLPLLLIWRAELLPPGQGWWLLVPILASAYGFCQVSAKTPDGYFLGFPSYWNVVAFYLWILQPPGWVSLVLIVVLALLTFVPSRYLYPTQHGRLNQVTNVLCFVWAGFPLWILLKVPPGYPAVGEAVEDSVRQLGLLSLFFPAYYLCASWMISVKLWRNQRRAVA
jgi:phosphatidylcholine synthase